MIRFKANPIKAIANITHMQREILFKDTLDKEMKEVHEEIKRIIAMKLKDDKYSTRDPRATNRGWNLLTNQIVSAITTNAFRKRFLLLSGGTGEVSQLDSLDPLLSLKNPPRVLRPTDRLWRILEHGAEKHIILARENQGGTKFNKNEKSKVSHTGKKFTDFTGSKHSFTSSKEKASSLRFFWKRKNVPFRGPMVVHPGQTGRHIWKTTAMFEAKVIHTQKMYGIMSGIIKKYSGRV